MYSPRRRTRSISLEMLAGIVLLCRSHRLTVFMETDVALAAILCGLLAKIFEQHATATTVCRLGIVRHGLDALAVLFLTVLVDSARQLDVFLVLATLQVADIGHLFAGNKADEMA